MILCIAATCATACLAYFVMLRSQHENRTVKVTPLPRAQTVTAASMTPAGGQSSASAPTASPVTMTGSMQKAVPAGIVLSGTNAAGNDVSITLSDPGVTLQLDPSITWQTWSVGIGLFMKMTGGGKTFVQNGPASGTFPQSSWNTGYEGLTVDTLKMQPATKLSNQ